MSDFSAFDLTVIIPTRDRWPILSRTLDSLANQSVLGFETVVVIDGFDQPIPDLVADHVLKQEKAGPGAARNRGVIATQRPLVLFLGDDIIPTPNLVEHHLLAHRREPEVEVAVLGHTSWHPDVGRGIHNRWLDQSASQFDYAAIEGEDAGWGRFYSSNVSLKRDLFVRAGGFDEAFTFDYEDLDLAYRLHLGGLRLRYAPQAVGHHLHSYDWPSLIRRYHSRGQAERQMAEKHDWFEPFFAARMKAALEQEPVSALWARMATRRALFSNRIGSRVSGLADKWYHQQLAAPFFGGWNGQDDVAELREFLGEDFNLEHLHAHQALVDREEHDAPDETTFYRTSKAYLYDLTMFALWGTKEPYLAALRNLAPPGARILDYGCGIGSDGLRLLAAGYNVAFADFDNPSTQYLRWRLKRRGLDAPVYDVELTVPGGFDVAYSFDVIEHVDDPFGFLSDLERRADLVVVNFLDPDPHDIHLHRPLPVSRLLNHATRKGLVFYHRYEGRSHLVAYRSSAASPRGLVHSMHMRILGAGQMVSERLARLPVASR